MRVLVQRVRSATVRVDGVVVAGIGPGLLALVGVRDGDTTAEADWLGDKLPNLRIFEGPAGKFEHSLLDVGGAALVVSQFTLYGRLQKGRRPDFAAAARPAAAEALYERLVERVRRSGVATETGVFAAHMEVELINDGPVTVLLEREARTGASSV